MLKNCLIIICLFSLSSCGIYRQNIVNVPISQKKGQIQLGTHISFNGYDGQASYSPTEKFTLLANYSAFGLNEKKFSTANSVKEKHNFSEIGFGYYKKKKSGRTSDIFLLIGNGYTYKFRKGGDSISGSVKPYEYTQAVNYNRFAVQADFINTNKKMSIALTPRLLAINYYNVADNSTKVFEQNPSTFFYTEGVVTIGVNTFKNIFISGQLGITIPITGSKVAYYEFSPLNCSIGLTYSFNLRKSKVE